MGRAPVVKGESVKYWLYPKVLNASTYVNHTFLLNVTDKAPISISLYQSDKFIDFGFRVTDVKCYERLVTFFDAVPIEHVAELESDLVVKPTVSLLGEVLLIETSKEKRRGGGFGGGFGRGFGGGFGRGFGGGFGRGFGFGGFGFGGLGALALLGGFGWPGFGFGFPGVGFSPFFG